MDGSLIDERKSKMDEFKLEIFHLARVNPNSDSRTVRMVQLVVFTSFPPSLAFRLWRFYEGVHQAYLIHKSRMMSLIRWFWFPDQQSPAPASLQSLCCFGLAEILVPWLLWTIKPVRSILLPVMLVRLLCRLIARDYGRQILLLGQRNHDL